MPSSMRGIVSESGGIVFALLAGVNAFAMAPHNPRIFFQMLGRALRHRGSFALIVVSV